MNLTKEQKAHSRNLRYDLIRMKEESEDLYNKIRSQGILLHGRLGIPCKCDFCPHMNEELDAAIARVKLKRLHAELNALLEENAK